VPPDRGASFAPDGRAEGAAASQKSVGGRGGGASEREEDAIERTNGDFFSETDAAASRLVGRMFPRVKKGPQSARAFTLVCLFAMSVTANSRMTTCRGGRARRGTYPLLARLPSPIASSRWRGRDDHQRRRRRVGEKAVVERGVAFLARVDDAHLLLGRGGRVHRDVRRRSGERRKSRAERALPKKSALATCVTRLPSLACEVTDGLAHARICPPSDSRKTPFRPCSRSSSPLTSTRSSRR